jgi:hypothetical protein
MHKNNLPLHFIGPKNQKICISKPFVIYFAATKIKV